MGRSTIIVTVKVIVAAGLAVMAFRGDVPPSAPTPSPSSTYQPDECTAEDVAEDGICLTWHDMHYPGAEWHKGP